MKQETKCYCGHTTYCDCGPLEEPKQDLEKENLDVTHYRNGDPIPFVKSKKEWRNLTTGAYCYYDNDTEKGVLYNWYAINDSRGLAPAGWKIPTIEELEQIDLSTSLPGGYRSIDGSYYNIGDDGNWWSSTENTTTNAWNRNLYDFNGNAYRSFYNKGFGLSVRCLKNEIVINKKNNMEVLIDGIVYVPKEEDAKIKIEPIIVERNFKFELHPNESINKLQWDDAVAYTKSLGDGWRLPTFEECFIMYNNKVITEEAYWSSSETNNTNAWYFYFNNGNAFNVNKLNTSFVRAVRSL